MKKKDKFYEAQSNFCHTITNPVRLRIIETLNKDKLNVSEIQEKVEISMSNLSNHLSALYKVGVLGREKQGNYNYYYLVDTELVGIIKKVGSFMEKISRLKHNEIT